MAARVLAHDWSTTELGPLADWPERTRAVIDLVLASPLVASVALAPKRRLIYNDAAARLYGDKHPGALGQPLSEAFPDSYPAVEAFYDRVFAGEAVCVAAQPLAIAGQDEVFDAYLTPVRDDAGAVIGAHMVGLEIGRQARAEAALRESEARYRSIFASVADGFYLAEAIFDADGTCVDLRYLDENAAAMRMTGQSFKGRLLSELGGYEPYWYEIFGDTAKTGTPHDAELFAAPDGIWYSFHTFKPPGAGANELVVVFSDVTVQHELADSEAMRRIALSGGRMGSWRWDRAADLIRGDAQFMALWGLPPTNDALPLATFAARMTPVGGAEMAEIVAKAVAAGEEFSGPLEIAAGPTAGHWVQWQGRAAADDPAVLYGVTYDITDQKNAEARLRESEERYRMLFKTMDEGFVVNKLIRDDAGNPIDLRYLELNPAVERLVGWKAEETVGRLMSEMITPEETKRWVDDFAAVIASGHSSQTEHNHDSLGMWFRANATPIGGDRVALVYQNITDQKRSEAILRESEVRQAFLLELSDALRPLAEPADIQGETTRLLREQLNAGWCYYVDWDMEKKIGLVLRDSASEGLSSLAGAHDVSDAPEFLQLLADGAVLTVCDYASYEQLPIRIREQFTALGFRSMMAAPLVKGGRLIATLIVGDTEPRDWSAGETSLLVEIAERTWAAVERGRAETALRDSEAKLRDLFEKMEEGYLICDVIFEDERAVDVEYVEANPAAILMIGVEVVGRRMRDVDPNYEEYWYELYGRVASSGITERDTRYAAPVDRWYDYRMAKLDPGNTDTRRVSVLFSDASARVSAELSLRESEERYRSLFESMDEAYAVVEVLKDDGGKWADFRFLAVNPAFMVHTGMPYPVGQTATELLGTPNPRWTELYGEALDTGQTLRVEESEATLGNTFDLNIFALDRAHNRVAVLFTNITDRKQAERALRQSEERQRLMVELVPALLWSASPDGQEISLNEGWSTYTGQSEAEMEDYGWLGAIHPADLPATRAAFEHAFATGEPLERQQRIHKAGDGYRWHLVRHIPVRDEHGVITRWFGAAVDIHDSKLAEQALQDTERRLQTLIEGVPQLVWRAVDGGHWTWASPQWTDYTGQAEPDSHDWGWLDPVHPDDREPVKKIWAGAIERGEFHADYRLCHAAEGRYRWFQTRATAVRDGDGMIVEWLGTSTDVDDLRELQERQQVLLAELQHRVRNILAVLRSIISRSDDGERSTEDYVQHLQGRISALARTQVLLTRRAGAGVDLEGMIRDELLAQTANDAQFSLDGPDVELSPKAAEVLTLAIHELATNATKYGAFTRPSGRLTVEWIVEKRDDQRWLVLSWTERGVPIVEAIPRRRGFGSELVSRRIPYELKGSGSFVLKPGGLESHIEFPLRSGDSILQTSGVA